MIINADNRHTCMFVLHGLAHW